MRKLAGVGLLLAMLASLPASAQVQKVVADAEGITWAACAAVMEIAIRRLDGVDQVHISMEKQQIAVTYKEGASFQPKPLREAVGNASVTITRFHLQARGRFEVHGDRPFFIAGKDRFLLVNPPKMPDDQTLMVGGEVMSDTSDPMELKVTEFHAVKEE